MSKVCKFSLITIIVLVIIGAVVWLLVLNPRTAVVDTNSGCYLRCKLDGYRRGVCLRGGSGTGSSCQQAGGTNISYRDNPVPGCSFEAIGSWDECCCF